MTEIFPQINVRCQADPGNPEKPSTINAKNKNTPYTLAYHFQMIENQSMIKKKSWKKPEEKTSIEERRWELHPNSPSEPRKWEWSEYLKCWERERREKREGKKTHQLRMLYLAKLSFKCEGKIKIFSNQKWGTLFPVDLPCTKC